MVDAIRLDVELLRAICQRECVLFVGSGFSASAHHIKYGKLPTWVGLLEQMLKEYSDHVLKTTGKSPDPLWEQEIKELINGRIGKDAKGNTWIERERKLLVAAQELKEHLQRIGKLQSLLDDLFDPAAAIPVNHHYRLPSIDFRAFITTNYDRLIETGYSSSHKLLPVLLKDTLTKGRIPSRPNDYPFLFKIHGDYSDADSAVLGTRDFQDVMYNAPGYRQFLQMIFSVYTVLFVGFSGDDPHLESLLDQLASIYEHQLPVHYILFPKGQVSLVQQKRLQLDRRVRVIEYGNSAQDHQMIEKLFDFLAWFDCKLLSIPIFQQRQYTGQLKIVLSYGIYADQGLVETIATSVKQMGHQIWDYKQSPAYNSSSEDAPHRRYNIDRLNLDISRALSEADCIITIFDENYRETGNEEFEALYGLFWATRRKLIVLPISIGNAKIPEYFDNQYGLQIRYQRGRTNTNLIAQRYEGFSDALRSRLDTIQELLNPTPDEIVTPPYTMPDRVSTHIRIQRLLRRFNGETLDSRLFGIDNPASHGTYLPRFRRIEPSTRNMLDNLVIATQEPRWVVECWEWRKFTEIDLSSIGSATREHLDSYGPEQQAKQLRILWWIFDTELTTEERGKLRSVVLKLRTDLKIESLRCYFSTPSDIDAIEQGLDEYYGG